MPRFFPQLFVDQFKGGAYDVCAERGISRETADAWEMGYDVGENAITIPARDVWGNCIGMIWRNLDKMPKYKYNSGFEVKSTLVGIHNPLNQTKPLLVEGSMDAILASQNGWWGLATLGAYLHSYQLNTLEHAGIDSVTVAFDHDRSGIKATEQAVKLLSDNGFAVDVLDYPKNYQDIAEYYGY